MEPPRSGGQGLLGWRRHRLHLSRFCAIAQEYWFRILLGHLYRYHRLVESGSHARAAGGAALPFAA